MWSALLQFIAGSGIFAGLLYLLLRFWLKKDIERYKINLQAQHDRALETLKSDLTVQALEREIRLRRVFDTQADVIATTYANLNELLNAVASYVRIVEFAEEGSKEEKYERVRKAYQDFREYYYPKKVFFPDSTCAAVEAVSNKLARIASDYRAETKREEMLQAHGKIPPDTDRNWTEFLKTVQTDVPPLMDTLRKNFQQILGVTLEDKAKVSPCKE